MSDKWILEFKGDVPGDEDELLHQEEFLPGTPLPTAGSLVHYSDDDNYRPVTLVYISYLERRIIIYLGER